MNSLTEIKKQTLSSPLVEAVNASLNAACMVQDIDTSQGIFAVEGMSGKRYRYFINHLIGSLGAATEELNTRLPAYLEIGMYKGATICSAIHGNNVRAVGIDNWSLAPEGGAVRATFDQNIAAMDTPGVDLTILEGDFRAVDYPALGKFDVYFYDGPHEELDQYDGVARALPALADEFVLIVDDWNWEGARNGTLRAIRELGLEPLYIVEIRTVPTGMFPFKVETGKESDWHNGYYIAVLRKS